MSDTWAYGAERFNKFHAPAGSATGGQFAAASGSSSGKGKTARPTPSNQHPVGQGETGKRVSDLQSRLNALGAKPPLKVDGIFGTKTLAAVKAFQKAHGLKVDGLVGPLTTAALRGKHQPAKHTPAHPATHSPAPKPAAAARAGGQVTNPGGTEKLHEYWVHGEGAAKIRWGSPGDYDRCVMHLGKFIADPHGYCAKAHHDALGIWPATHAAMEHKAGRADMAKQDVLDKPAAPAVSRAQAEIRRDCQLEDIHIVRTAEGDSSGRVVEAYATVFDQPVIIRDEQGHYNEVIDRGAFNDILAHIRRSSGGLPASVKVLYNHGKTMEGVPAPEFQKPLGKPLFVEPESRGLLTRTEYGKTPLAEELLELIRGGSITAQSFVGGCITSDPQLRGPGDRYRARNGALTTVRRMILGLREYGPVLWAAYTGAEILGVRMALPGTSEDFDPNPDEEYASANEEDVTGSVPEDTTSTRYHQHALYVLRAKEAREAAGLVW